jgi:hypothetical protein
VGRRLAEETRRQLDAGAEVVYLNLPLNQPATPHACEEAVKQGYFFSGVGPLFAPDGDALRLQFLSVPLDLSLLIVHSPLARALLEFVAADRPRIP